MKLNIGKGSCGIAAGANKLDNIFQKELNGMNVQLTFTGCIGMCYLEPIVELLNDDGSREVYVHVDESASLEISNKIKGIKNKADKYLISDEDNKSLKRQTRIALRNTGIIDPSDIDSYIERSGYQAIQKCVKESTPEQVIDEIKTSGLAGRGGAGFPTWIKWNAARQQDSDKKYTICNADEGDPGAFMDRAVIEGDPHSLIEGMLIGAFAMGSDEGVVYVRAEYPLAIERLTNAIEQAGLNGYLGQNLFGSDFSFDLRIKAGAGAFVCGEETALIASLEGERGMPRFKPPFPAEKGYWQKPTNINNVETYANVPWILLNGGAEYAKLGTEQSKGTKVFALTGKIAKGGLVEVPMGYTIRDVIEIGGGIKDGKQFKAVQMGGPSGGCIPESLADTVIDYKSLSATGAIMGSGGMVVMDETTCMVDMARFFLEFTCNESCGKCVPCRIGTKRMLEILERITTGEGQESDIDLLTSLSGAIKDGALCGLGNTAPNPVLTTLKYFRNEYEDHINGKCTAKQCKKLIKYTILPDKCKGCSFCFKNCPVHAIEKDGKIYKIDTDKCTKCGKCGVVCKFEAVDVE